MFELVLPLRSWIQFVTFISASILRLRKISLLLRVRDLLPRWSTRRRAGFSCATLYMFGWLFNSSPFQDLKEFLDGAEHGVIIFSFGSSIRADTFPPEKRDAFIQAFSELPQKVLWKWEGDILPGQPTNVKIVPWIPQMDVLGNYKYSDLRLHTVSEQTPFYAIRVLVSVICQYLCDPITSCVKCHEIKDIRGVTPWSM